jgi:hypothetical protein
MLLSWAGRQPVFLLSSAARLLHPAPVRPSNYGTPPVPFVIQNLDQPGDAGYRQQTRGCDEPAAHASAVQPGKDSTDHRSSRHPTRMLTLNEPRARKGD